jgi:hypothetical protein
MKNWRTAFKLPSHGAVATASFFVAAAMVFLLFAWWDLPVSRERFVRMYPSYEAQIPKDWTAIIVSTLDGTPPEFTHWALGTVDQNPKGFYAGFIIFVGCAAIFVSWAVRTYRGSLATPALYWDSRNRAAVRHAKPPHDPP